jgi:hypothetical protein
MGFASVVLVPLLVAAGVVVACLIDDFPTPRP